MKKISLSKFDLGFIIAFVVVAIIGGVLYWYLSGQLYDAQLRAGDAKSKFDKYAKDTKYKVSVNPGNVKALQENIDLIKQQIDPVMPKLSPKESKLKTVQKQDPVAWKHELDDNVHRLTAAAKGKGVSLPPNFYFGFVRYLSQSPSDEQTTVLSKQLLAIDQIASILIKAPVKSITLISRSYEEDSKPAPGANISGAEKDKMLAFSFAGPDNAYISYPFEIEFVTSAENLRPIVNDFLQSPYIFIVRSVTVTNSEPISPRMDGLDALAGVMPGGGGGGGGDTPQIASQMKGPQYLFGDSTITVRMRVDLIEWKGGQ